MRYFLKYSIKILKFKVKEIFDFVKINRKMSSVFFLGGGGGTSERHENRNGNGRRHGCGSDLI